jgi:hypothetical protein
METKKEEMLELINSIYEMINETEFKKDTDGFKPEKRRLENRIYSIERIIRSL